MANLKGKHVLKLYEFLATYAGLWVSIDRRDRNAMRALAALERKGLVLVKRYEKRGSYTPNPQANLPRTVWLWLTRPF